MRKKIISNLLSSSVEKFFILGVQFISSIILIRLLPRDDYGIIGIVMGYFVFVNIANISLESIILRDHKKFDENLTEIMQDFFMFNIYKSMLFVLTAFILSFVLSSLYENSGFIYAIWSITFIIIAESITNPFVIYFSSKFNQKLVTKISIARSLFGLTLLLGLFAFPYLWYVALKDLIVNSLFICLWVFLTIKKHNFVPKIKTPNFQFIKESFFSYSLWTHLNGVVTNFIYRSDTLFLSFFVSLTAVGNYTVALNSANIANIIPMILGYQNSVAISNAKDEEQLFVISNAFIKLSFAIGVFTLIGFAVLGNWYIWFVTGKKNYDIYFYMMCIVGGLVIVKSFASPLNAYINIYGSVKKLFSNVMVYSFIFTLIIYFLATKLYGAKGIAISNVLVAMFWLLRIVQESLKYNYRFSGIIDFSHEFSYLKKVLIKCRL